MKQISNAMSKRVVRAVRVIADSYKPSDIHGKNALRILKLLTDRLNKET